MLNNQRGDTIVEVLIAIAIVSSVLAGAFTVSQKSSVAVRTSQEKSEMLHLLNGQIELVRAQAQQAEDTSTPLFGSGDFCLNPSTGERKPSSDAICNNLGPGNLYDIKVKYDGSNRIFTASGTWDGLSGQEGSAQLAYRVYPGQ